MEKDGKDTKIKKVDNQNVKTIKNKTHSVASYSNEKYFLKLSNEGTNACFCNSTIQALLYLDNSFIDKLKLQNDREFLEQFSIFYEGFKNSDNRILDALSFRKYIDKEVLAKNVHMISIYQYYYQCQLM